MRTWPLLAVALCWPGAASAQKADVPTAERFQLDNGLTVLVRPVKNAQDIALVVLYHVGGDHDPKGKSGLGHLVEHLYVTAAAGNAKARTAEEFMARYPRGANAQTGDRYTVIATVFPKKDLDDELKDAAARMGDLRPDAADVKREVPRVLVEVRNMFEAFPHLAGWNNARELVRPTPLGGRKGGLPAHVQGITLEDLRQHWQALYRPNNAILILAGAVEPQQARKAVEREFGKLKPGDKAPPPQAPGKAEPGAMREIAIRPRVAGAGPGVYAAYPAPEPTSDLYAPFLVLGKRLEREAAQLNAGPGQFPVNFAPLDDPSTLIVSATARKGESMKDAVARLDAFVAKAATVKVGNAELATVRAEYGRLLGFGEWYELAAARNVYGVAFSAGRLEQLGITSARIEERLKAVTEEDIRRAAAALLTPERRAAVLVVPRAE